MQPKYTVGNWKAVFKGERWEICSSDNKVIAHIDRDDLSEANARLIAASPIMLEAPSARE